ncbi:hypothetical protein NQ176_g3524 [Zarea fungicola]|uniref:Uncharacterized protein n=1 Tax=Zarea fungicola TaxID=93591 RepID=A0ACC1NJ81_9HYPO|nr:hypothetical protein NQ176_g3524 [Lecanicillium fungicola]
MVYQFPNGTQLENIAVRANGNLLITRLDVPEIYEVNPLSPSVEAKLLHYFPGYLSVLGITELTSDHFAIITGNLTGTPLTGVPKSFSIWTLYIKNGQYKFAKAANIPDAILLNGLSTLNAETGMVLASDSTSGVIFRIDTRSGKSDIVLSDQSFKPVPGAPLPIGINGIRTLNGYVYYTNSFAATFNRVQINTAGEAIGGYENIAQGVLSDDFAIRPNVAYVAGPLIDAITKINLPGGQTSVFAGNRYSTLVAGATSAQFGRSSRDENVLYVITNGGDLSPVNGTFTEGGKIVAFNI